MRIIKYRNISELNSEFNSPEFLYIIDKEYFAELATLSVIPTKKSIREDAFYFIQ